MIPLLAALFGAQPALAEPPYKGYQVIEQTLTGRLLADGEEFSFRTYLKVPGQKVEAGPLLQLLGEYNGTGNNEFANGDPNSVNMLLWQLLLQLAGKDLAARCQNQGHLRLNPVFEASFTPLCQWPAASAKTDEVLRAFWLGVMGYDAPEEELLAWENFALTSGYASKPAAEAIPALFLLITYNPYFLLRN
jgi:hypothetical protein